MNKLKWQTKEIKLTQIVLNPLNPRIITDSKKNALRNSLNEFGLVEIPVLNQTDKNNFMVISGHQRIELLREQGSKVVECRVPNRPLTESEAKKYTLIANTHAGYFNPEILDVEYSDVVNDLEFVIPLFNPEDLQTNEQGEQEEEETTEEQEAKEPNTNVIAVQLTDKEMIQWLTFKEELGVMNDKTVILKLMNEFKK